MNLPIVDLTPDAPGEVETFVRELLWGEHLECCGCPEVGATYMDLQEEVCCGNPEPSLLNDRQIVASLRAKFPETKPKEVTP